MRRGISLVEILMVLFIGGLCAGLALPRFAGWLDAIATDAAARDVTTALAVTRNAAVMWGTRARLRIAPDSLRIDRFEDDEWRPFARWAGAASRGATLEVSNPEVTFGPTGVGRGAANTTVVVKKGTHSATVVMSRLGRVRRE